MLQLFNPSRNIACRAAHLLLFAIGAGCSLEEFGNGKRPVPDASFDAPLADAHTFPAPETFASNQINLAEITLGEKHVVWTADGNIRACLNTGPCAAPDSILASADLTGYVRVVENEIFYSTGPASGGGSVRRCDLPDCRSNVALQYDLGRVGDLAPESDETFFLYLEKQSVLQCPSHSDCTPKTIASGIPVSGRIALHPVYVFWTAPPPANAIFRALRSGGNASDSTLIPFAANQANALSIAVNGDTVYWATVDDGHVRSCPIAGCGGAPHELATEQSAPRSVTVDDGWVYWANSAANTVARCPLAGCKAPEIVAKDVANPVSIAIDRTHIYIAARGANAILRIAK